jgi:hypothetical protein
MKTRSEKTIAATRPVYTYAPRECVSWGGGFISDDWGPGHCD